MITFLVLQIKMGKITIDEIPAKYKEEVKTLLNEEV